MKIAATAILVILLLISGCGLSKSPALNMVDVSSVDFSNMESLKKGSDCAYYLLGFIGPFGDIQLTEAIEDGRISHVTAVDYQGGYYILFGKSCINV